MTRVCATCTTILSRYTKGDTCNPCRDAARLALLAEQAENHRRAEAKAAAEKANPVKNLAVHAAPGGPPAPGTIRARILAAMPGTAADIAATVDEPRRNVTKYIAAMMKEGKVVGEGPHGRGANPTRVYRRAPHMEEAA